MAVVNEPLPGAASPPGEAPQPVVQSPPAPPEGMTEARPGNPPPALPIEATPVSTETATPPSEAPLPFERQIPEEHRSFLRRFLNKAKEYGQSFVRSKDPRYIASLLNDAEWRKYRLSGAAAGGTASGALAVAGVAVSAGPVTVPAGLGVAAGAILANRVVLPKYESYRSKQLERIYSGQELQDRMVKLYGNTGKLRNFAFGTAVGSAAGSMVGHGLASTAAGTAILEGAKDFVLGEPQTLVTETMGGSHTTVIPASNMLERAADNIQDVKLPQPDINIPGPNITLPDLRPDIPVPDLGAVPDAVGDKLSGARDAAGDWKDDRLGDLGGIKDAAGALKDEKLAGAGHLKDQVGNTAGAATEGVRDFVAGDDRTLVTESMGGTHTTVVDEPNMVERAGDKIGMGLGDAGNQLGAAKDALGDWKDDRLADAGALKDEKLAGAGHLKDQAAGAIGDKLTDAGAFKDEKLAGLGNLKDQAMPTVEAATEEVKDFVMGDDRTLVTETTGGTHTTVIDEPNMLQRAGDHIGPALENAGENAGPAVAHAADAVHDGATAAAGAVDGAIAHAADAVNDVGTEALEQSDPHVQEVAEKLGEANERAGEPLNQAMDASSQLGAEARNAIDQAVANPNEAAHNVAGNVGGALHDVGDHTVGEVKAIHDAVSDPLEAVHNIGTNIDKELDNVVQTAQEHGVTGQDVAKAAVIGTAYGTGYHIADEMKRNTIVPPPANVKGVKQPGILNRMKGWLNR